MAGEIPQWAEDRALDLMDAQAGFGPGWAYDKVPQGAVKAFASYIAEHEQEPVDPLLIEAREIAATAMKETFADVGEETLSRIRTGEEDDYACVAAALAALRRGIELGKSNA